MQTSGTIIKPQEMVILERRSFRPQYQSILKSNQQEEGNIHFVVVRVGMFIWLCNHIKQCNSYHNHSTQGVVSNVESKTVNGTHQKQGEGCEIRKTSGNVGFQDPIRFYKTPGTFPRRATEVSHRSVNR